MFLACEPKAGTHAGLRPPDALAGGRGLPGGRGGAGGLGQPEHPPDRRRCTPRTIANGWSSTTPPSTAVGSIWGDRVQRPVPLLPEAARPRRTGSAGPDREKRRPSHHQLASAFRTPRLFHSNLTTRFSKLQRRFQYPTIFRHKQRLNKPCPPNIHDDRPRRNEQCTRQARKL